MSTVFVDLVKSEPLGFDPWFARFGHRGGADPETRYRRYCDKFQPYRVVIKSGDNQKKMFRSTERYFNRTDALNAITLAFGTTSNVFLREHNKGNELLRRAAA